MDICEGFLGVNSLKGEVILLIGVTARKEKEPIKALKRYVDEAKAASVSGESKDNFKNSKNKASILKNIIYLLLFIECLRTKLGEYHSHHSLKLMDQRLIHI